MTIKEIIKALGTARTRRDIVNAMNAIEEAFEEEEIDEETHANLCEIAFNLDAYFVY